MTGLSVIVVNCNVLPGTLEALPGWADRTP